MKHYVNNQKAALNYNGQTIKPLQVFTVEKDDHPGIKRELAAKRIREATADEVKAFEAQAKGEDKAETKTDGKKK